MNQSYPQYVDIALQENAISLWKAKQLVAFPTETVYGLGADASSDEAVARIFSVKSRPRFNPLIVHVASSEIARRYGEWNEKAEKLAKAFWPGPLTLVLKKCGVLSDLVTAGGDTVALRIPAHPIALSLLSAFNGGIAAPSANRFGRISPTCAAHVKEELGDAISLIIDGGACAVGLESSVVDLSGAHPLLWRAGGISRAQIEAVIDEPLMLSAVTKGATLLSPGLLESHYAPTKPVRLGALHCEDNEGLLAFGTPIHTNSAYVIQLSDKADTTEAATRLFASLRALDHAPVAAIAVMDIPMTGLGEAINDRLARAAAIKN